jgi:Flp pilus assembly protein TadD
MIIIAVIVILLSSCESGGDTGLDADAVAINNRGVALMGQFDYEAAMKEFSRLVERYPDNHDIRVNLAIATFNRQAAGDEQKALAMLNQVLEQDPGHLRARYCSGLLELHRGQPEKALEYFLAVIKADPADAEAHYFAGKALVQLSKYTDAIDYFKRTLELDNYIRSAYYGMIMALRQLNRSEEAFKQITEFQRLQTNPRARLVEFKYTRMGRKSEVLALDRVEKKAAAKPVGAIFNPMKAITIKGEITWRTTLKDDTQARPGITVCDMNGDKRLDIFITSAVKREGGTENALLTGGPGDGQYSLDTAHPLAAVSAVNAALWGDLNDDGIVDVYLCRKGPNQLWQQDETGKWQEVTETTGTANGNLNTVDGAVYDADHDGDLDLFLVNADGPNELFNNNRDGTFKPLAAAYGLTGNGKPSQSILIADLDADRDADVIVINRKPPHDVYINELLWKYRPAKGFDAFIAADIRAAVAGDLDTDGRMEIYSLDSAGNLYRWPQKDAAAINGAWEATMLDKAAGTVPGKDARLALTDVDGDGKLDMIASGRGGWWAASVTGSGLKPLFTLPESNKEAVNLAAWTVLNTGQGPAVLGWLPGKAPVSWSPGTGRYAFASVQLTGLKDKESSWRSNASGIGMRLSVRVDSRWTVLNTFRSDSGPGQGLQPVTVGLGGAERIDFIAIDWSDGVFQTEMNLAAGKHHKIIETQRQLSSCPLIFAWNGTIFQFVSDFLGVGGIGYQVGPGEYSEPRPRESFMFPERLLRPRNGVLQVKLNQPMEEAAYMDAVRLTAYDMPVNWSMTVDERMGISGPQPTGEPLFYRKMLLPVQAVNDRGEDVTAQVARQDLKAASPGKLDRRFIGLLEQDHVLTVTFARSLDFFPGKPVLLADGWLEYPYSQTNFAAWQAGARYRAPTIEVQDVDGHWTTVLKEFGYPAGMPRQMSVPLPALPAGVRKIRITTNQEIYWDRLAVAFVEPCPQVKRHTLKLERARLEQSGFPKRTTYAQRRPEYDYNRRKPFWDTMYLEGYYTRLGDVEELVMNRDNALAIYASGETLHLEFAEPDGILKKWWKRVYVLETDGWCKDMDPYTHTGETVEPLPLIGKRTAEAERLHKLYNTRYLSGR